MKYKITKETKPTLATFGKYKAVATHYRTIETEQLLKEVCENNPISEGTVTAVVWKLAQVINRHLREGDKVNRPEGFKPRKNIRGVRLHFIPESSKGKPELYKGIKFEKEK